MNTALLGRTGSGRTRYLYSWLSKVMYEGKKGIVLSEEFSVITFVDSFFNKYGDTTINKEKINNLTVFDTVSMTIDNIEYFLEDAKERKMDFIVIDASSFSPELVDKLLVLTYDNIDLFFVGSVNRNLKFNGDYNKDKLFIIFDKFITIERNEKEEHLLVTTSKVEKSELTVIEEKIYGLQSLVNCEFH